MARSCLSLWRTSRTLSLSRAWRKLKSIFTQQPLIICHWSTPLCLSSSLLQVSSFCYILLLLCSLTLPLYWSKAHALVFWSWNSKKKPSEIVKVILGAGPYPDLHRISIHVRARYSPPEQIVVFPLGQLNFTVYPVNCGKTLFNIILSKGKWKTTSLLLDNSDSQWARVTSELLWATHETRKHITTFGQYPDLFPLGFSHTAHVIIFHSFVSVTSLPPPTVVFNPSPGKPPKLPQLQKEQWCLMAGLQNKPNANPCIIDGWCASVF